MSISAVRRYVQLFLQPIPSHLDWIGRVQMVVTGLVLLGVGLGQYIAAVRHQLERVPGGTSATVLASLLLLAFLAGIRLAAELEGVRGALSLYIESGGLAVTEQEIHHSPHTVYHVGDLLIINTGSRKTLLRIRIVVPINPAPAPQSWHRDEEIIYGQAQCIRGDVRLASDVGEVPHLSSELSLGPNEHVRGHTELVSDLDYLHHNYGNGFQRADARLEIEDLLSGQFKLVDTIPFQWGDPAELQFVPVVKE